MRYIGFAAALVALAGCSAKSTCVDGQSAFCACTNGASGAQLCTAGKFEVCICDGIGPDMSVGNDMSAADLFGADFSGSDLLGSGGDSASATKRVFVTSLKYNGNLKAAGLIATNGGAINTGLEGGDALCQTAANTASLGGTWKAYLSDSSTNAYDRMADVGPWSLVGGPTLFPNKAALKGQPASPINRDQNGTYIPDINAVIWTGTLFEGGKATNNCMDWLSASSTPQAQLGCQYSMGPPGVGSWSSCGSSSCDQSFGLYCFEQ